MAGNESPAPPPEPASRGRGRGGGRGGRGSRGGRGGGRGGGSGGGGGAASSASAWNKQGRGGTRRGRAKIFADPRVQAAYERQRDLKATYQAVAYALKPALQELAERSIDELLQKPTAYKQVAEHVAVTQQLQSNLDSQLDLAERRFQSDLDLARRVFEAEKLVSMHQFENGWADLSEKFDDSQDKRLRILSSLRVKDLPVDIRDDQYEFRVISDNHLENEFGIYQPHKDGRLVPYPSRVEGTEMWLKGNNVPSAAAAPTSSSGTPVSRGGRGRGRGGSKRRAQEQPDGQPMAKKSTRSTLESQLLNQAQIAPAPAKGLLASAAEAETQTEGMPVEEESVPASPDAAAMQANGAPSAAAAEDSGKLPAREKSPPLPKNLGDADEYGVRIYNQKGSLREKGMNSRLLAPHPFKFDDADIGFRDSTNDSSKGHTRAKRGKYLDTPNSNGMHFDHWCNGYDYSCTKPSDFDQDLVKRYGVHPKYGIFLPGSTNMQEPNDPYVMPGKPIVYIAQPSGRIAHSSRSFQETINYRSATDAPFRVKTTAALRRFCKMDNIPLEDISVEDYLPTEEELRERSLGTAAKELESRTETEELSQESEEQPVEETVAQPQATKPRMALLAAAIAIIDSQEATTLATQAPSSPPKPPAPAAPSPPAPRRGYYDAIRDAASNPVAEPVAQIRPLEVNSSNLNLLAELCHKESLTGRQGSIQDSIPPPVEPPTQAPVQALVQPLVEPSIPPPVMSSAQAAVLESDVRNTIQRDEPPYMTQYSQAPMNILPKFPEPVNGYSHSHYNDPREHVDLGELPSLQPSSRSRVSAPVPVSIPVSEPMRYQPPRDQNPVPPPPPPPQPRRSIDYQQLPPPSPAPPVHEHHPVYYNDGGYPGSYSREVHMAPARPIEPSYGGSAGGANGGGSSNNSSRRLSAYGTEAPGQVPVPAPTPGPAQNAAYHHRYWTQPAPVAQAPPPPPPPPPPHAQHYQPPPPLTHSRMPFSHGANAEPLPPLRPSRSRAESIHESDMRSAGHGMNSYYAPAPHRTYHHSHQAPETHAPFQPMPADNRMLQQQQQQQQGPNYMNSPPPQPFAPPPPSLLSPTFASHHPMPGGMVQSPPGTPQGLPSSAHRHRSTLSGSSDMGSNKYRRLQPAPVPAHRAWPNQPELKTIPYDHKETGSSAALPNSGPTQIRGWNVNQPRKRSKADKQAEIMNDRDDSR